MKRRFNITGSCNPQRHYMVRLDDRLKKIKEDYIDIGNYFIINRGRQYGKTTTLHALEKYLKNEYIVLSLDFQLMGTEDFSDETTFSHSFFNDISIALKNIENSTLPFLKPSSDGSAYGLKELFADLSNMCKNSSRPIVLMIDEVDSASNNQVFIDFLAQLRGYYLKRDKMPIFHSVILAGVYDIKNLKLKLRPEAEHQYNSPWNIAAKFKIDMNFSADQIASMLEEYEADYHTGMDIQIVAKEIYQYTSGYPVLVSSICKCIDEELHEEDNLKDLRRVWSKEGVADAVKNILKESTPLFESMIKQLDIYKNLRSMIESILYQGRNIPFSPDEKAVSIGLMFGFLAEKNGHVIIANRIFEMYLLNLFMTEEAVKSEVFSKGESDRIQFIKNNRLDMELVLKKFVEYFNEIYGSNNDKFIETYGRKFFLLYLKSIINGTGNYYLEAQTRDARRTDVIVDYLGEQFIIELKIWHGNEYNERGRVQLADYLEYYHKDKGYMLSFNFNKNKKIGVNKIKFNDKTIIEAVV